MQYWPKLAQAAFSKVLSFNISPEADDVLHKLSSNPENLKKLFFKIDALFNDSVNTPGKLDRRGEYLETAEDIKKRFWLLFFQSFAGAASLHSPEEEKKFTERHNVYVESLKKASDQAKALRLTFEIIQQKRNESVHRDGNLRIDPIHWVLTALDENDQAFDNPFYDDVKTAHGRYDRHQPKVEQVLQSLSLALHDSHEEEKLIVRRSKLKGLIETLVYRFQWYESTCYTGHLPSDFISQKNFSGTELALLINTAWGSEFTEQAVNKARSEILNQG